jgi:hypothetical protein
MAWHPRDVAAAQPLQLLGLEAFEDLKAGAFPNMLKVPITSGRGIRP